MMFCGFIVRIVPYGCPESPPIYACATNFMCDSTRSLTAQLSFRVSLSGSPRAQMCL